MPARVRALRAVPVEQQCGVQTIRRDVKPLEKLPAFR